MSDQLDVLVHVETTAIRRAVAELRRKVAAWEPRPMPAGWNDRDYD